ncbi:MAG: hypothetical protein HKL80_04360 [Acidimicrobiales bacterium]|nr:hypothetical protein [Acidimicrobiales bacterium]
MAYNLSGQMLPNWPVVLTGLADYYGSAMDALTEGISDPITVDPTGSGTDDVIIAPLWTPPYLVNGSGSVLGNYGSLSAGAISLLTMLKNTALALTPSKMPPDTPIPFDSFGALGVINGNLDYVSSEMGAASFVGAELGVSSGLGINNYVAAYPVMGSATPISGFPAVRQGTDFLGSPLVTDVTGNGEGDIIESGDASALMAFSPNGSQVATFPKFTGGWIVGSPSAGDLLSNGHVDLVATTRDGYLMAWSTPGLESANNQWWHSNGNEWNLNEYGVDSRSPGVIQNPTWITGSTKVSFVAPGNDWYSGQATSYNLTYEPSGQTASAQATVSAGGIQTISVSPGSTSVIIQAVNAAGNLATPITVDLGTVSSTPAAIPGGLSAATGKPFLGEEALAGSMALTGVAILAFTLRKKRPSKGK